MTLMRVFVFGAVWLPFVAATAGAADLTVTVKGVRSSSGAVLLAVYDREGSFMNPAQAKFSRKENAAKGEVKFVFHDVPPGKYAVASFHDENGNGKLDTNAAGIPTEGYGFSNDAQGYGGPPAFLQAAFDFDGKTDKAISFALNY
jgi:uncharacterized protein (DUF2141 family)